MKLGTIPCFIPILFAANLNKIALSAIRKAVVYARAVSYTPGPVSVSAGCGSTPAEIKDIETTNDVPQEELQTCTSRQRGHGSSRC